MKTVLELNIHREEAYRKLRELTSASASDWDQTKSSLQSAIFESNRAMDDATI